MTYVDRRQEQRPTTGEAPFHLDEVFYSRTDNRGVIQSGNYVFQRVANYQWSDLIGAPHKIVRHPDMPRGVFWYFWNQLNQGNPIGAYVKNRARDGLHYWVYAVVLPFEGGYLSARIKPSSDIFKQTEALYADLKHAEAANELSPQASAELLLTNLSRLGYADYEHFSAIALAAELTDRDVGLKGVSDPHIELLKNTFEASRETMNETAALIHDFEGMQTIPHNLRVIASRLEPTGGPVSTLSQNYGTMSRSMSAWFEANIMGSKSNFNTIGSTVASSLFLACMVRILNECEHQMRQEHRITGVKDIEIERAQLLQVVKRYQKFSHEGIERVRAEADRILKACDTMNRHVLGLSSTRVMCKIECARQCENEHSLEDIIHQLKLFQDRILTRLDAIENLARTVSLARI